jgi:TRAP-type C4-dicarboxylate transport system permease small subunit
MQLKKTRKYKMRLFWKLFQRIVDGLKIAGTVCLVGMTFLTCADVIGRFFDRPIFGSVEIVGFLATIAVATGLVYTHQMKGHIGVEILVRLFSDKVQTAIEVCTGLMSLLLFVLITWRMAVYAGTMRRSGEVSMNLEFPEYVIIYVVAFCFLIFSLQVLHDIIQNIAKLKGNP